MDSKGKKRKRPLCQECRGHGDEVSLKGHKKDCPFSQCFCHVCERTDDRNSSIRNYRTAALLHVERDVEDKSLKDTSWESSLIPGEIDSPLASLASLQVLQSANDSFNALKTQASVQRTTEGRKSGESACFLCGLKASFLNRSPNRSFWRQKVGTISNFFITFFLYFNETMQRTLKKGDLCF